MYYLLKVTKVSVEKSKKLKNTGKWKNTGNVRKFYQSGKVSNIIIETDFCC